ncbi:hypothetical protein B7463_g4714, partial [Scytalidium lignicola]
MAEAQRITDPSLLSITTGLSNLNIGTSKLPDSGSATQKLTLVLLQPLANADMLAACCGTDSRLGPNPDSSNHQILRKNLNIRPLSKAWRQAVMKVPPISDLTFNLTLPKGDKNTSLSQRLYWEIATPQEGGLIIETKQVMYIATTIATEMRMRSQGDVRFEVIYDKADGTSLRAMSLLKKQLLALAEFKGLTKRGEEQSERNDTS